jgi:hypothetical protein
MPSAHTQSVSNDPGLPVCAATPSQLNDGGHRIIPSNIIRDGIAAPHWCPLRLQGTTEPLTRPNTRPNLLHQIGEIIRAVPLAVGMKVRVSECRGCPFASSQRGHPVCDNPLARGRDDAQVRLQDREPPEWCPLRGSSATVYYDPDGPKEDPAPEPERVSAWQRIAEDDDA